jgi:hypothetical protein
MCAGILGCAVLANAAPSPPVEVPALPLNPAGATLQTYRQDLEQQRALIMERYQKWKTRADAFNEKYVGHEFDEDSPEAKDGAIEQAWLSQEGQDYQRLANAFKAKVGKLTELLRLRAEFEKIRQKAKVDAAEPMVVAPEIPTDAPTPIS